MARRAIRVVGDESGSGSRGELQEADALRLAQAGDAAGFEWLIRRHVDAVFGFLVRWLGDRELAEEVFQEAAVRANQHIGAVDPSRPFKPWFFRIAVNRGKSCLAARARHAARPLEVEHAPEPSGADRLEARSLLERALDQLRPNDRKLLLLRFGEELTMAQVATVERAPLVVVQMRVSRARKRFRAIVRALETEVGG